MITFSKLGSYGRIGNMMFEVATTIAHALRNNDEYVFPPWQYEKDFNLHGCFSNKIPQMKQYIEPYFHYKEIPYWEGGMDLVGFFQSPIYFEDYKNIIIGLLTPKITFKKRWDTTSVHIRRGDYINLKNEYAQLDTLYYKEAMEIAKTQKYLIVSDDIEWCKGQFIGKQFEFSDSKDPVTDLSLQISCANQIIANSSFSWWAAYLNTNPSKIVVAPNKWFGPALQHDTKNLLLSDWIKI